ncbi:hypothetical protein ENSA7_17030 [Enhygromyxa salina]|uniref:Uncharacterized protein n=2 Tax=Enhygromyxa salina TaxID=215803 RepID=A0A2S9YTK3_9BACT|nr:hypothetical protein ENSA7_17030 [Enhygromyxa salina]
MRVLGERWVLTLALADPTAPDASPYPTPLFFALAEPNTIGRHPAPLVVVVSDPDSHHGQLAGRGPTAAAAAVYLETQEVGQVRGAQLRGSLVREDAWTPAGAAGLRQCYLDRHPIAAPMLAGGRHRLYALAVSWAKLTDNRLGFGAHPVARFDVTCAEVEQSRP